MSSRRSKRKPATDAPITGVAAGGLGTAANLDDTQVMKTADLEAAAPAWLASELPDDDQEPAAPPSPPAEARPDPAPTMAVPTARPARRPRRAALAGRSLPAMAGAVAVVILLVVAGAGFFSQLDLGAAGAVPTGAAVTVPSATEPAATQQPKAPKDKPGHGGCRGHGHGNDCGGGG